MDAGWDLVDTVVAAAVATFGTLRRWLSSVKVGPDGARVRNFPGRTRSFARDRVSHIDWVEQLESRTARRVGVLWLADGSSVMVRALDDSRPGATTALNNQLLGRDRSG